MSDLINRPDVIEALLIGCEMLRRVLDDTSIVGQAREKFSWGLGLIESFIDDVNELPSAESEIAENLYLYKCFITDKDGLQHEVIHTGDIRRVTGWEI